MNNKFQKFSPPTQQQTNTHSKRRPPSSKTTITMLVNLVPLLAILAIGKCEQSYSPYYEEWVSRLGIKVDNEKKIDSSTAALVIVDMQNDFVGEFSYTDEEIAVGSSPCFAALGSKSACFGVAEGKQVAEVLKQILRDHKFSTVIASLDDHSPNHCSFFASASATVAPQSCKQEFEPTNCDTSAFHGCRGTFFENNYTSGQVSGPFPPHCVRGYAGSELYSIVGDAMKEYQGDKHVAIKGLDLSTDSFGVFSYSEKSWDFYNRAGLFSTSDPSPALMIRSMLTWEKNMKTSTGAAAFTSPFDEYTQPPPFSTTGAAGSLVRTHADALVASKGSQVQSILVTGLAGDWCVLDSALNAKALWPDKEVYYVIDSLRPAFLSEEVGGMYLKKENGELFSISSFWLNPLCCCNYGIIIRMI